MSNIKINPNYSYKKSITVDVPDGCEIKINNNPNQIVKQIEMVGLPITAMESLQKAGKGKEDIAGAEFEFLIENKYIKPQDVNEKLSIVSIPTALAYALHTLYIDSFLSTQPILQTNN